jgi:hypothetical protein
LNLKTISVIFVISIFISLAASPAISSINISINNNENETSEEEIELYLLRGEYYLYLDAKNNVGAFDVKYSFPPELDHQFPVHMQIMEDSTAQILDYEIETDDNDLNKFVIFNLGPMNMDQRVFIHFNYWVLIKNSDYSDLPEQVSIPKKSELPQETLRWLVPTKAVQSDRILIRLRARQMRFLTDNLLKVADRIASFTRNHRYLMFLMQYYLGNYRSQDAFTTLLRNGECPGRSHLGSALFRANGVPARVLMAIPSRYKFWFEMHFMTEYFCPGYGWILTEVHGGKTPYEPKNQIIQRICYPEDEEDTHVDYIYPKMKCIEKWFWIENENVEPYYKDLKEGSKTRGYQESEVFTSTLVGEDAIQLTKDVFNDYEHYLTMTLTGENLQHFNNAVSYQNDAVYELKGATDPFGYIYYLQKAQDEYSKIILKVA